MRAFILAGGYATRLWPLTEKRAKPLLPLAGKLMIDSIVEAIPDDLHVTVSTNAAFAEDFKAWEQTQTHPHVEVIVEHTQSDDDKLGALGAIAQWITDRDIEEDILILTGDNHFGFSLQEFLNQYKEGTPLIAGYDVGSTEAAKHFGTLVLKDDGQTVEAFEEKPKEPRSSLISTGCTLLPKTHLDTLIEYAARHPDNVGGIYEELIAQNQTLHCFTFTESWFDVGSFDAYMEATKTLVGSAVQSGEGSELKATQTEGSVVLGKNCTVQNSVLENVVLFDDCQIENCVLRDCVIDDGTTLKNIDLTGKMIRAGTELIGNLPATALHEA